MSEWESAFLINSKEWKQINLGKAGRARNLGRRPSVRGVAKNAVDHPHGGELFAHICLKFG